MGILENADKSLDDPFSIQLDFTAESVSIRIDVRKTF